MAKGPTISTTFNAIDRATKPMQKLMRTAKYAMAGLGVATAGGLAVAGRSFLQFDEALTNASSKFSDLDLSSKAGQESLKAMGRVARKVAGETKFSADETAQGLDYLAMAGFSSEQAMKALPGVANLATVANTDFATATDIASDAAAFAKSLEEALTITDPLSPEERRARDGLVSRQVTIR